LSAVVSLGDATIAQADQPLIARLVEQRLRGQAELACTSNKSERPYSCGFGEGRAKLGLKPAPCSGVKVLSCARSTLRVI